MRHVGSKEADTNLHNTTPVSLFSECYMPLRTSWRSSKAHTSKTADASSNHLRAKIPYDSNKKSTHKRQQYCKKFNKDLKTVHIRKSLKNSKFICLSTANKGKVTLWQHVYSPSVTMHSNYHPHRGPTGCQARARCTYSASLKPWLWLTTVLLRKHTHFEVPKSSFSP